jgi:hypothetical protein
MYNIFIIFVLKLNNMKHFFTPLFFLGIFCFAFNNNALAQPDEDDEDYSDYGTEEGQKRYCTPKVVGLSPQRLISIGYEVAAPHTINAGSIGSFAEQTGYVNNYNGLVLNANLPIIATHKFLLNLGMNYAGSRYNFANSLNNPFLQSLDENIRTVGINTTIFKPFNEKWYGLAFLAADYSGDFNVNRFHDISNIRATYVGVIGKIFHDRFMFGLGATQTYRAGAKNILPVIHWNYTSKNDKWGIEALLPARMHYRYAFTRQDILLAGFEVLGSSYFLTNENNRFPNADEPNMPIDYNPNHIELRRSEIRFRLEYTKAISGFFPKSDAQKKSQKEAKGLAAKIQSMSDFIWIGFQVGVIQAYRFDADSGNFMRLLGDDTPFLMENTMGRSLYFQLTLNLVSP